MARCEVIRCSTRRHTSTTALSEQMLLASDHAAVLGAISCLLWHPRLAAAVRRPFSCAPMQRTAPDPSVDASSRGPSEREREIGSCRRAARSRSPAARGTCMCRGDVQLHYNRHSLGKYLKLKRQLAERCRAGFLKQNLTPTGTAHESSRACIPKVTASWRSSKTASWPPRPKVAG